MGIAYLIVVSILVVVYHVYRNHMKRRKQLPPGPPSLPLVGGLPFISTENGLADCVTHPSLHKYHPYLCTVWLGPMPAIIIQDYALAKELFASNDFSGRSLNYHNQYVRGIGGEQLGIVYTAGKFWQEQRRFTEKHINPNVTFGPKKLDSIIQYEANDVINAISAHGKTGKDMKFDGLFNFPIINILWQILTSRRYYPDEPEAKTMMSIICEGFEYRPSLLNYIPFIRTYAPFLRQPTKEKTFLIKRMFREQITEHENTFDEEHEPNDFVDYYLREIYRKRKTDYGNANGPGHYSNYNVEQLIVICMDFFQAGAETTSSTLSWIVMYLTLYPIVQEKCRKEICQTIGGMH